MFGLPPNWEGNASWRKLEAVKLHELKIVTLVGISEMIQDLFVPGQSGVPLNTASSLPETTSPSASHGSPDASRTRPPLYDSRCAMMFFLKTLTQELSIFLPALSFSLQRRCVGVVG